MVKQIQKVIGIDGRCLLDKNYTGVSEYTVALLRKLIKDYPKNKIIIFLNSFKDRNIQKKIAWLRQYKNVTVKHYYFPNKILNFSLWFFKFPKLDKLLGGVDIFIAPNISFLAISRQSKFILTIHDLSFEYYKKTFSYKRRLWHFFVNPRFLAQRADEIWTVSQSTRSDVMNLYKIAQRRVKVKQIIKYLDDFSKRRPLKIIEKKIRRKYHLPNKFILYLGTIEPRKNILSIIQTFEYLKKNNQNFKKYGLVIAGQLGWKYKEITEYIKKSSYAKEIILTDFVRHQDKVYLYKLATIFIFPSLYEGFGIPVLEAMKSGVPVITANNSSLPEVIGEAGLMVDVERITDIIDAVEQLVENRELREKLKEKGYQRAEYLLAESERLKLL